MRALLTDNLEFEGYHVTAVESARGGGAPRSQRGPVSLVLLDLMLPGMSGFELCERLRDAGRARADHHPDGAHARAGSDPRPRSRRRRLRQQAVQRAGADGPRPGAGAARRLAIRTTGPEFTFGDVTVNVRQRLVTRKGRHVPLSAREFELLRYLVAHRNEVVSREQLLRDVWGYHQLSVTRTVDNYVAKLRNQLEPRPHEPRYIVTVHGSGYQLLG